MNQKILEILIKATNKSGPAFAKVKTGMQKVRESSRKIADSIKKHWKAIAVAAISAIVLIRKAWDAFDLGAKVEQQRVAFHNLAVSYGADSQKIVKELRSAAQGTLTTMQIMEKASRAMTLGLNPEQFGKLMEISRASAKAMGQSVEFMFDSIVLGIGRQSRMILDNLGIIVKAEEAYKRYAQQLGKTVDELTDVEKRQAFMNAALKAGEDIIGRVNSVTKSNAELLQTISANLKQIKEGLAEILLNLGGLEKLNGIFKSIAGHVEKIAVFQATMKLEKLYKAAIVPAAIFGKHAEKLAPNLKKVRGEIVATILKLKEMGANVDYEKFFDVLGGEGIQRLQKAFEAVPTSVKAVEDAVKDGSKALIDMEEVGKQSARNIQDAFGDFIFRSLEEGFGSLKDVISDFGRTTMQMLSQLIAQALLLSTIRRMAGVPGWVGSIGTFLGGGVRKHTGGKLHAANGMLASDEVPIIAQSGERVLSRGQNDQFEQSFRGRGTGETEGAGQVIINMIVQAWDATDVFRNRKKLAEAVAQQIANNAGIRGTIKNLAR